MSATQQSTQQSMPQPFSPQSGGDDEIDLMALLGILLDYKWLVISCTVIFACFGCAYAVLSTPVYQADALIQIEGKKAGLPGLEDLAALTGKDPEAVTEIELLKSRMVVGRAVDSMHLDVYARPVRMKFIGNFIARRYSPDSEGDVAGNFLPFGEKYDWGGADVRLAQLDVPENMLGKPMTLVAGNNGTYRLEDEKGELLLEGTIGQLASGNDISLFVERMYARPGQNFVVGRNPRLSVVDDFRAGIKVAERGRNTGIVGLSLEDTDPDFARHALDEIARQYVQQNVARTSEEAAKSLQFLREQLPQVRQELDRATTALNQYQVSSKSVDIGSETKGVLDQVVKLEGNISDLSLKQAEMDKRFTPEHPAYQTLIRQLSELRSKKKELEQKVADLPETQQELFRLTRDVQVATEIYTTMMDKSQELDIMRAGVTGNARIIDFAEVDASSPVKPKKALIVLLATALGGIIGIVLTGLHVALTRGIEDPSDIESLGLPVNATIPYSQLQAEDEKKEVMSLLALSHPTDPAVEAIRSLRTSLHFMMMDAPNNIMAISGPSPQVGKTFVSVNMAVTMAQVGKKVLLIDADMRKGYIQKFFKLDSNRPGLSSLLQKQASLEEAVYRTEVPNLDFIARGPVPTNPSELLLNPLFEKLLQHASANYDIVIIDTPPILAVADALIVSKLAGSSFIVARFSKNPLGEIQATIKRFANNGVKLSGAILNATQKRSLAYYGYQKYGYGNYQYHYYGVDQKKTRSGKSSKKSS
jgi:tyrosine-protein kinase Etk/Wzc